MAASTALPPRFKISIPTCVAAGTLVQTMPCRASTSDRVAKVFPVIRSTWAEEYDRAIAKVKIDKRTERRAIMVSKISETFRHRERELSCLYSRDPVGTEFPS